MNLSGRQLAAFLEISPRTVGRLERAGLLERQRDGAFSLQASVKRLLEYYSTRERWAFRQLARHRIFDEHTGDVFELPHQR